ncbi:hypothetical protein O181_037029 [Austropuccinia psidii MF-1]|uniref:ARID domain-containing protein n=1 Tax=Austropuccinia psidii MF-1 TaxID=1389203 RepID=A0A9Q3D5N2_9BASI|nr:hypothetical protein [Austropuccinia psidii MF-1]
MTISNSSSSAIQALPDSPYSTPSPHLSQASPSNNPLYQPSQPFNITPFSTGLTVDKFIITLRDTFYCENLPWPGPSELRGKELDLYKLFTICATTGGFNIVTSSGLWTHIAMKLDIAIQKQQPEKFKLQAARAQAHSHSVSQSPSQGQTPQNHPKPQSSYPPSDQILNEQLN